MIHGTTKSYRLGMSIEKYSNDRLFDENYEVHLFTNRYKVEFCPPNITLHEFDIKAFYLYYVRT